MVVKTWDFRLDAMKIHVALALMVLLAGCSQGGENLPVPADAADENQGNATAEPTHTADADNATAPAGNATAPAGNATGNETLNATSQPTAGPETYYLHAEGTAADDTYMDHTPAAEREAGSHTALVAQPTEGGYDYTFPATEPTLHIHPAGSEVQLLFYGWTIAPHPAVTVTGTLTGDGGDVGSGSSDAEVVATLYTSGAVAALNECVEFTVTFDAQRDIDAQETLSLRVSSDYPLNFFPCFDGGTETSRLLLG